MRDPSPIEIVGGGPAGLATGLALVREGVPVTLFEAGRYPRHRVCGEFISGLAETTSDALGIRQILDDARPHLKAAYHLGGRHVRSFALPGVAWGISRYALDERLAQAFVQAGGILRSGTRADERPARGRVFAGGRRRKPPLWVGLKVHVHGMVLTTDLEVHLGDRAYVGLSRVETGAVNVCGLFAKRAVRGTGLALVLGYLESAGLGEVAERIRAASADPESACSSAASLGDRSVGDGGRLWIGDACASIPPFTGNGLAMALQGAEEALTPLRDYAYGRIDWRSAIDRASRAQRRRFRRRLLIASALHPFFLEPRRQLVLAAVAGSAAFPFRTFYRILH